MKRLCLILLCLLLLCGCGTEDTRFQSAYGDVMEQSTVVNVAAAEGCFTSQGRHVYNLDRLVQFVEQSKAGVPCELRVVQAGGMVHHVIYDGECYLSERRFHSIVTTKRYPYLVMDSQSILLSNMNNFALAEQAFRREYSYTWLVPGGMLSNADDETLEHIRGLLAGPDENRTEMTVWSESGTYQMQLSYADGIYTLGDQQYRAEEVHPTAIVPYKGNLFAVLFEGSENNSEARLYDAKAGTYVDSFHGLPVALVSHLHAPQQRLPEPDFLISAPTLLLETASGVYVPSGGAGSERYNIGYGISGSIGCGYDPPQWEEWTEVPAGEMRLVFDPDVTPTRINVTFWPTEYPSQGYDVEGDSYIFSSPGFVEITAHFEQGEQSDTDLFYDITASYGFRIVE